MTVIPQEARERRHGCHPAGASAASECRDLPSVRRWPATVAGQRIPTLAPLARDDNGRRCGLPYSPRSAMTSVLVEACVDAIDAALEAERGGAGRIELCGELLQGGVTPSAGLIAAVWERIDVPLFVLVRPRPGDFLYTDDELDVMRRDIEQAKAHRRGRRRARRAHRRRRGRRGAPAPARGARAADVRDLPSRLRPRAAGRTPRWPRCWSSASIAC